MTARELIRKSFLLVGAANPTSIQYDDALSSLNTLLINLAVDNLNLYAVVTESFPLVVGTSTYTIGSGGDFSTVRPTKILEGVYIKDSAGLDYPVIPMSRREYNRIVNKIDSGRPTRMYYEAEYTLGKIRFNYKPSAIETLYIDSWKPITEIASLATTISLPPEYLQALKYNLAVELAIQDPPSMVVRIANSSLEAIRENNSDRLDEPARYDDYMLWEFNR
jgi:hypothetical protein